MRYSLTKEDYQKFMDAQIREIEYWKWIESENAKRDLGQDFIFNWIERHAKNFFEAKSKKENL